MLHGPSKYLNFKTAFYFLSVVLLFIMPMFSLDAGISGDEKVHYDQSLKVYNYYKSFGKDKSALDTPQSHLKYYGQSFDNITTIIIKWLKINDIYKFRHIANSLAGWLTIFIAGLLAVFLGGYRTGILTLFLLLISPRFMGHSWNNLKDIPFALGYIASLYFIFLFLKKLRKPGFKTICLLVISLAFAISIRISGILLIFYFLLFLGLYMISEHLSRNQKIEKKQLSRLILLVPVIILVAYIGGLLLWPFGLESPVKNPWISYKAMAGFPTTLRQIFEGSIYWSDQFPWYYLLKYMLISIPALIITGLILFFAFSRKIMNSQNWIYIFFLIIAVIFPLAFIILKGSNVYGGWRHVIFIYPPMVILATLGFNSLLETYKKMIFKLFFLVIIIVLSIHPVKFILKNHPYEYLYFNEITGGLKGAYGNYETDYYFHSIREASEWLISYNDENKLNDKKLKIAMNFPESWFFRNQNEQISIQFINYYYRANYDWDFSIIANEYLNPYQLMQKIWPPENTIHTIRVEGIPVCAILKRITKDNYLGFVELSKGNYKQSKILLKKSLEKSVNNEAALINLAETYVKLENYDSAKIYLNKCLKIYPDYEVALNQLAIIAQTEGNFKEAERLFIKNLSNNNKYFPSYIGLAKLYFETNQPKSAIKYLNTCLKINPRFKPALIMLGNYYKQSGQTKKAMKFLNFAKKL
ncbi:MAG: hypothetical protein DRI73_02350 [Bacteroidetes bacterium]|nr:MAG: hypothetical protein DRI73_02350 [Bacteroidota bacterium]